MPEDKKKAPQVARLCINISTSVNYYIISIAFTKAVVTNGKINVSHSQCVTIAIINAAVDAKKTNHHTALYFLVCSIVKIICAKIRRDG